MPQLEQKLQTRLVQKLIITPQLQQAIKLLQLSKLDLQEEIAQELLTNPALEEAGAALETTAEKPTSQNEAADAQASADDFDYASFSGTWRTATSPCGESRSAARRSCQHRTSCSAVTAVWPST